MRNYIIFLLILLWRIVNVSLTKSYFQADEFWQALEPAHYMAFGYGELTWEWKVGLRSYGFPFVFEIGYRFVRLLSKLTELGLVYFKLHNNYPYLGRDIEYVGVIYIPKLIMAFIATVGEYYTILLIHKVYLLTIAKDADDGKPTETEYSVTNIALVLTLTNFFNCFFITRSFINTFEMILTAIALYYWDWTFGKNIYSRKFLFSLIIAIFACLQRPSNGLIWLIQGSLLIYHLVQERQGKKLVDTLVKVIVALTAACSINCTIDYYFYGHLTFPIFKFITFNFTTSLSEFYGVAPWHFHLAQSLPIVLGYSIIPFFFGMFCYWPKKSNLKSISVIIIIKVSIILNLLVYSMLSHKEFRFIYPLQPFFQLISTFGCCKFLNYIKSSNRIWLWTYSTLPIISIVVSVVVIYWNESGVIEVMKTLHKIPAIDSVGFIMPCHSTPWQSYLHRDDIQDLWAITCDPPLHLLNDPDAERKLPHYMDESDYLYDDIPNFIRQNFPPLYQNSMGKKKEWLHTWPEYLVIFEQLDNVFMREFLEKTEYSQYERYFNSFFHWDSRRKGDIIIYHRPSHIKKIHRKII